MTHLTSNAANQPPPPRVPPHVPPAPPVALEEVARSAETFALAESPAAADIGALDIGALDIGALDIVLYDDDGDLDEIADGYRRIDALDLTTEGAAEVLLDVGRSLDAATIAICFSDPGGSCRASDADTIVNITR